MELPLKTSNSLAASNDTAELSVAVLDNLAEAEAAWRQLEETAAGSAYQRFDFLSAWQRSLGKVEGVEPFIIVGRAHGEAQFYCRLESNGKARSRSWNSSAAAIPLQCGPIPSGVPEADDITLHGPGFGAKRRN